MRKKIKNNDLIPWFTMNHADLPPAYLKSCQEFFTWLDQCNQNGFQAPSSKLQAPSNKQVTNGPEYDITKTEREKK
jgi:hypothetical protein